MDLVRILIAFALVFANGFFVAAEFAIVKVRATRMRELARGGSLGARAALRAISRLDAYLSATQLGITLASLGLGWIGEPAFSHVIVPVLHRLGVESETLVHSISATTAFALISFLHIVLGELAPKSLAIQRSEATAVAVAQPLYVFYVLFYPALWLLNTASNGVLRLLGIDSAKEERAHSEEELRMILAESAVRGVIPRSRSRVIENVLKLSRRTVRQIMTPRSEIHSLSLQAPWEETLQTLKGMEFTRYPLTGKNLDEVLGIVHIRDLLRAEPPVASPADLLRIKREALFVPEQQPLDQLQRLFQSRRQHMAIVVDEYGGTAGLVTLENVLEVLVGDIQDEFDAEQPRIVETEDGYRIQGRTAVEEVMNALGEALSAEAEAVTIGGLFFEQLGRIPREGDALELTRFQLVVKQMQGRRVELIQARRRTSVEPGSVEAGEPRAP